jgi:hypothetical protein
MHTDPHKNASTVYPDAVIDLNRIRDDVASLARAASTGENVPYRARLLQAQQLMALVSYIHGSWTDAFCAVQRQCAGSEQPTSNAVEAVYSERLISKLENAVETAWVNFGGRSGEDAIREKEKPFEADIAVLAAEMMHQCLAAYCDIYVERLRERVAEIRDLTSAPTP